jgi:hypothetical protein
MVSTAVGSLAGALLPLPIAAASVVLTLAHTKAENNNNTANHWLKTLFFIMLPPRRAQRSLLHRQYPRSGKPLSMTSEVMEKRGVEVERFHFLSQPVQHRCSAKNPQNDTLTGPVRTDSA